MTRTIYIDGMEGGTGAGPTATEDTGVPGMAHSAARKAIDDH